MDTPLADRIAADPNYQALKSKRSRFGWTLTLAMLVVYYGFILLIAFSKDLLAVRIGDGVMTWGIPIGFGVIVFTVVITAIYVQRANSEYDDADREGEAGGAEMMSARALCKAAGLAAFVALPTAVRSPATIEASREAAHELDRDRHVRGLRRR